VKAILTVGHAGTFSSDGTMADDAADVRQGKPCPVAEAPPERRTLHQEASVPAERSLDRASAKETPMTQHSHSLSGFLHGFKRLLEPAPPATGSPAPGADERPPLDQEVKHLEVAVDQLRQRTAAFRAATSLSQQSTKQSPAEEQQALEAVHQQVGAEILALHAQLQTHLTLEEIQQAQALMRELDAVVLGKAGSDMEQQIKAAVITRLVKECAPLAWQTLLRLLERAQVSWPEPIGLSPHADAQAVQATRQWELAQLEEAFLSSSLERSANRALGVVENWKAHYPPPDSHAWKRVVLQAVGYGILGYLLSVAVPKLRGDSADFTARVGHVLHEELATLQQVMQAGVHSAADADALMASVTHLCEEVVPTMAWEEVAPDVHKALQRFTG
jgi:hypothetical protein